MLFSLPIPRFETSFAWLECIVRPRHKETNIAIRSYLTRCYLHCQLGVYLCTRRLTEGSRSSHARSSKVCGNTCVLFCTRFRLTRDAGQDPVNDGPVARAPWNTALVIRIPMKSTSDIDEVSDKSDSTSEDEDGYYTTIPYHSIAKHMMWKRLLGLVQKYVVIEHPLA